MREPARFWGLVAFVVSLTTVSTGQALAVDPNGVWLVNVVPSLFSGPFSCHTTISQSGTSFALTMGSDCQVVANAALTGTWDASTNQFTADAVSTVICPDGLSVGGTVAPDGGSFAGGFSCGSVLGLVVTGSFDGSRCGNGVLDPGEQCDTELGGPVCCPSCTASPASVGTDCSRGYRQDCVRFECGPQATCDVVPLNGDRCDDDNACTTGDRCQGGSCTGTPTLAGTHCDLDHDLCTVDVCDGSGTCTAGACSACCGGPGCSAEPVAACVRPDKAKAKLALLNGFGTTHRSVKWKWKPGSIALGDLGTPTVATDYRLCVYQPIFNASKPYNLAVGADVPAAGTCGGVPCWRSAPGIGFKYGGRGANADGITKLALKAGGGGAAALSLAGKGSALQVAWPGYGQLASSMIVQLQESGGPCWESRHSSPSREDFLAFVDAHGSPSGAFVE